GDIHHQPGDGRRDRDLRSPGRGGDRPEAAVRGRDLPRVQEDLVRGAVRVALAGGGDPGRGGRAPRSHHDAGDGKDARLRYRGGEQVRPRVPLLRRERRRDACRREDRACGRPDVRPLPAHRARAGHHAVELPVLAGLPVRGARAHGRERGAPEACLQRAAVRACDRGHHPPGRFPRGGFSDAPDLLFPGPGRHRRPARAGGDAHRQRARRAAGRQRGRREHKEDRARARRQRPVHRDAERRPRRGHKRRRHVAHPQQRAVLHQRQAHHRPRGDSRRLYAPLRRRHGRAQGRRPDGREHGHGPARNTPDPGRRNRTGGEERRGRGEGPDRRQATGRAGQLLPADRPHGHTRRLSGLPGGDLRPRRLALPGARHRGGYSPRQRLGLRPELLGLDDRSGRAGAFRQRVGSRHDLHKPHDRVHTRDPVRRRQELGVRTRALPLRHPRVHEPEDGLGGRERRGRGHHGGRV
ncbi:MAG: Succinate-semialdehyde dehydrogenase [NAD]; Succinate-semialdehyde dehydrogenase [NADP+], partial [uncultured Rubrobacteraceae bacterium]